MITELDADRLAELAACMAGSQAAELLARVLNRTEDEDFTALRDRLAREALRLRRGPVIIPGTEEMPPIVTWLRRLPVADRVLLTLRYEEHLGVTELAAILDRPRTKIESRLNGLLAEVPVPAEAYLGYGLTRLAATAPATVVIAAAVAQADRRRSRRRVPVLGLLGVACALLIIASVAVVANQLPAVRADEWQFTHRVAPPGWVVTRIRIGQYSQTTWLRNGSDECGVEIGVGNTIVFPARDPSPDPVLEREVRFGTETGWLYADTDLQWTREEYDNAVVVCPTPGGGVDRLFAIAESVRSETRALRIPIGLPNPPTGARQPTIEQAPNGLTQLTVGRIYFTVAFTPRLGGAQCRWLPPAPDVAAPPSPPFERRIFSTPTGDICAEVRWVRTPDSNIRKFAEPQLKELVDQLVVAPDPTDPATWFDARDVLPQR